MCFRGHLENTHRTVTSIISVHPGYRAEVDAVGNILLWPISPKETEDPWISSKLGKPLDPITVDIIESALANARAEMDGKWTSLILKGLQLMFGVQVLITKCAMSPG